MNQSAMLTPAYLSALHRDLSAAIKVAYGSEGLGILVVRGVPDFVKHRATLLPLARKFALLPEETKLKYEHLPSMYNFGWSHGKETFNNKPDMVSARKHNAQRT